MAANRRRPLPALWDGADIEWHGWHFPWSTIDFHAPKDCCGTCGSTKKRPVNQGNKGRVIRFVAFRCLDCWTDVVHDERTQEWWTLDDSDYGPAGSACRDHHAAATDDTPGGDK